MIQIVSQPRGLTWSNNDIVYKLKATDAQGDLYGKTGIVGRLVFNTSGLLPSFAVNDTVVIAWTIGSANYTETFIAQIAPTGYNQIPATITTSFEDYFKKVLQVFQSHPNLSSFFLIKDTVIQGAQAIEFISKEISATWSINIVATTSATITATNNNTIEDNPAPTNYKIKIEVLFQDIYEVGGYDVVSAFDAFPDSAGIVVLNLKEVLHRSVIQSYKDALPPHSTNQIYKANNKRKYYIRYAEASGEPITVSEFTNDAVKEAIIGGIDKELFAKTDYLSLLNATNSFLTWYPASKEILPTQKDYVTWFNYSNTTKQILLEVVPYIGSTAGSKKYIFDTPPHFSVNSKDAAIIPISKEIFDLADTITSFTVQVIDGTSDFDSGNAVYLSQKRLYVFDCNYYKAPKTILFLNSFYLPETVALTGETDKELNVNRSLSSHVLQDGYRHTDKEISQYDFDWDNTYTYRTGFLRKQEVDALQQLLIYNLVWEVMTDGYRSLIIEGRRFRITQAFQFLHTLTFDIQYALKAENYSAENIKTENIEINLETITCPISIVGRYFFYTDAVSAALQTGDYFALMEFAGVVLQIGATSLYQNDTVASSELTLDSCYSVSANNIYGLPQYTVRKLNPTITYNSDTQAAANIAIDEIYYAGNAHQDGVPYGTAIIRKN